MTAPPNEGTLVARLERIARILVPFLVSGALLAYVFRRIDIRVALDYVTGDILLRFLPALVVFLGFTLVIEAQCLHRVTLANPTDATPIRRATAARIKAACYLLGLLNYALGALGLSILLQRRARSSLAAAAGMVFLISLFDIGSVLVWVAAGAALLQAEAFGIRLGLLGAIIFSIVAGFAFLRAPLSMGPLERVRELEILRALRSAPLALLVEIGILRLLFVSSFVALVAALFWAFGIEVGLIQLGLNVGIMLVVSALPIAAGGLGTGQIVFVELFSGLAPDAQLLSASIVFSFAMIVARALLGLLFAPEFTREALAAARAASKEEAAGDESEEPGPR
ncbi:MAG: hypothetical protein GY910_09875 [bacterium]|nr:hypothetical protein [bacterium]